MVRAVATRSDADFLAPGSEPDGPYPARFRWLKRLAVFCFLLAASLFALRLWWGREAQRRLDQALAPVVSAGLPIRPADLKPPAGTEQTNAAAYLLKANRAIVYNDSPAASSLNYPDYPPYGNQWDAQAEKAVKQNGRMFLLARDARAHDRVDFGVNFIRPAVAILLPHLNEARNLAINLADGALYAHFRGDDAAALETIRDIRHIARTLGHDPFVISHLVTVGIEMLAAERLEPIAAKLRVGPEAGGPVVKDAFPSASRVVRPRPAPRDQVRALIGELLDDSSLRAALRDAYAGERAMQLDTAEWFGEMSPVLRPMFRLEAARMAGQDEILLEAAQQPSWPAAQAVLARGAAKRPPPGPPSRSVAALFRIAPASPQREPVDYTTLLSSTLLGTSPMGRPITHDMRATAEKRMVAVSLAAQLYRADHNGAWPPSLDALVPQYLPHVPRDPLAPDDKPLGYVLVKGGLPGDSDRPLVYSVGANGRDDTANGAALPKIPYYGWHNDRDEWRDLTRWTPGTPTTPATGPSTQGAQLPTPIPTRRSMRRSPSSRGGLPTRDLGKGTRLKPRSRQNPIRDGSGG
jgi:hypothetical protein